MQGLVWGGAALALIGLAGLIRCILQAMKLRRAAPDPEETRRILRKLQVWNLASVATAFMGLALTAAGVILS